MWELQAKFEVCIIAWGTWETERAQVVHHLLCHQSYLKNISCMMSILFFEATKPLSHHTVL